VNQDFAIGLLKMAIFTGAQVMAPLLAMGMLVGITVGALQAATQVNEPTLTFVPKALTVGALGAWLFPWGVDRMVSIFVAVTEGMAQIGLQ